jgi:hypothetical protein
MKGIALQVFAEELRLGGHRGDLTTATRTIAKSRRLKYESLKRAVTRHRDLRDLAVAAWEWETLPARIADPLARIAELGSEFRRRATGLPPDVLKVLLPLDGVKVLKLFRHHRIDGTAPRWFIKAVREWRDLMSPK